MTTENITTTEAPADRPRKRKRVFMWFFLAVQLIFVIWLIVGLHGAAGSSDPHAEAVAYCANGGWQGLYQSYADCLTHYAGTLNAAKGAGTAIGAGLVIALWVAVDVILGVTRLVVVLARKR